MLERDVANMTHYYGQYAPELLNRKYAKEMWALYEDGKLHPDTPLTGNFAESTQAADVDAVLDEIKAVIAEEQERLREAQEHNN
ncbi:RIO-type serine/threonine kinase domain protein [Yersinia pestis PY-89]|nr:RIO-type serine/threonine kinase domain protein [Yersinia pestis PY-89]